MNNKIPKKTTANNAKISIVTTDATPQINTLLAKNQALTIALSQAVDEKVELQTKLILAHQK